MLWQMLSSFHLYTLAKEDKLQTSKIEAFAFLLWGASTVSIVFGVMGNQIGLLQK
jgi:hypothetical protein